MVKFYYEKCSSRVQYQQTFLGLEDVLKTSSTRLQRNNLRLPRRLEDVLQRRFEDVLEDEKLLR